MTQTKPSSTNNTNDSPSHLIHQSPHNPLLLLPSKGTGTKVLGVRYSCENRHIQQKSACLPINNGMEPHGKSLVIDFESDLFIGTLLLRIQGVVKSVAGSANGRDYFQGRKRTFQAVVRGRFKSDDVRHVDCVTGQIFQRSPGNLPGRFVVNTAISFMKNLAPQLQIDLGDKPYFLSPLCATAQVISVSGGESSDDANTRLDRNCKEDEGMIKGLVRRLSATAADMSLENEKEDEGIVKSLVRRLSATAADMSTANSDEEDEGFVRRIVRRTSNILIDNESCCTSRIEFSDISSTEKEVVSEENNKAQHDRKQALKLVRRLSKVVDLQSTDSDSSSEHEVKSSEFSNEDIEEHNTEEPAGHQSLLNEIPDTNPAPFSKSGGQRLKHRKKLMNKMFSKRHTKNSVNSTFSSNTEYTFEFYQHLIDFDQFSLKLPMYKPTLSGPMNGQPLQVMAAQQKSENGKNLDLRYLWSFDIWHKSLLKDAK